MIIRDPEPAQGGSLDQPTLSIHVVSLGDEVLVVAEGEVDALNLDRLRNALDMAMTRRMVLDLADLTFFDAATVSVLLGACADVHTRDGTFAIRAISPLGRRMLAATGLDVYLGLSDTVLVEAGDVSSAADPGRPSRRTPWAEG